MPGMGRDAVDAWVMVGLLGPVEIGLPGGPTAPVAQPRLRVLLGLLAVAGGRLVSTEALVDGLWGGGVVPGAGEEPALAGVPAAAAAGRSGTRGWAWGGAGRGWPGRGAHTGWRWAPVSWMWGCLPAWPGGDARRRGPGTPPGPGSC